MDRNKCVIILSEKSSGSSACLKFLKKEAPLRAVRHTRHNENETLYWVKAASVLERPQIDMVDSEVPIAGDRARQELQTLITQNVPDFAVPGDDDALVHEGWRALCESHGPYFLEKSPHHLCQWSAIELILDNVRRNPQIDFLIVGLVRNPMDTIFSQFDRWRSDPEAVEIQWREAYQNLLKLQQTQTNAQVTILRYEEMVSRPAEALAGIFAFCGTHSRLKNPRYLHNQSIQRWRQKFWFGFRLKPETLAVARQFGYTDEEMENRVSAFWPAARHVLTGWHRRTGSFRSLRRHRLLQPFASYFGL
ncbi:sulfotransferase [Granulosicoccaceae sp. 1_MG-2023]|nr:sulfotransferase [Granulosicoccaceae sp. 1_MG-2023]